MLLHTDTFAHRNLYTDTFTRGRAGFRFGCLFHSSCTIMRGQHHPDVVKMDSVLLDVIAAPKFFIHRRFLLHRDFYTQKLSHTNTFTRNRFDTQTLTHRHFHTETFTHRCFYTQTFFLHRRFQGHHCMGCMSQGHKQQMHTTFRNVVYRLAARAGARPVLEPDNLLPATPLTRPADVLIVSLPDVHQSSWRRFPSSRWIVLSLPHSKVLPSGLLLLVLLLLPTGMLT